MKFTDGVWLTRPGVQAGHPVAAYDLESTPDTLTVHAVTRPIRHRGDTLQGPLLTIELSAPAPDVIRVRLTNFAGGRPRGPRFALSERPGAASVAVGPESATLTSGRLSAQVRTAGGWRLSFHGDGRPLTASGARAMGSVELAGAGHFMHEQLDLGVGELVYGLGERFSALVKNGQVVEIWNKDGCICQANS